MILGIYRRRNILFMTLLTLIVFMNSCMTHKKSLLINDGASNEFEQDSSYINLFLNDYKLQPGDILNIKIASLDPEAVAIFNKSVGVTKSALYTVEAFYINGYIINNEGSIDLPIVGAIEVQNLTISKAEKIITEYLNKYYKLYNLSLRLVNYRIDILGEVNKPGSYYIYNKSITILSLLSESGGFGEYASRRRVKLIRQEGGKNKIITLNLQDLNSIEAKYYFLMPRDIIYVEPDKSKAVRRNAVFASILLSTVTLLLAIINFSRN